MDTTTIVGNLTRDPELRHAANGGKDRAFFGVAVNRGRDGNETTTFFNVTVFGAQAQNVVNSLSKGDRAVIVGRHDNYSLEAIVNGDAKNLTMLNIIADEVSPSLRWAEAKPIRNPKGSSDNGWQPNPAPDETDFDDEGF